MRALLQRVSRADVRIEGESVASIGSGLLVLLGVGPADDDWVASGLAAKVAGLRVFADAEGLTNLSLSEVGGSALVVSQFTLFADARRGRRPSFIRAAGPIVGERLYEVLLRDSGQHRRARGAGPFRRGHGRGAGERRAIHDLAGLRRARDRSEDDVGRQPGGRG